MTIKSHRSDAVRAATGAFCRELLDHILPPIREVARHQGYAVAVHGSLSRDIDLIAVAWAEHATSAEDLVTAVCGAVAGVTGACHVVGKSDKPFGRKAFTLAHRGFIGEIDLSVIPPPPKTNG